MLLLRRIDDSIKEFSAVVRGDNFNQYVSIIRNLTCRKYDGKAKIWRIGIFDYDLLIQDCKKQGLDTIDVDNSLKELVNQFHNWENELIQIAEQNDTDFLKNESFLKIPMMPHQRVAAEFMYRRKMALNCSEMGTGKTFPALAVVYLLHKQGKIKNCLIVSPVSVKWNWVRETEKFFKDRINFRVVEGNQMKRLLAYQDKEALFIAVNYEVLRRDILELEDTVFDCIVVDEVHRVRNSTANLSKALHKLGSRASYRFGLTGTPVQNKLMDMHSIMKFIQQGVLGEYIFFNRRHIIKGYFGEISGYQKVEEVNHKLKSVMFRRLKSEVLKDLPPKVYQERYVQLTPEQSRLYKTIKRSVVTGIEDDIPTEAEAMVKMLYLRRVCDSAELIENHVKASSKLEELKSLVDQLMEAGKKIVIFSQWVRMLNIINRELDYETLVISGEVKNEHGIRDQLVQEFHESKEKNIFLITTAGGEGINLQCADYIIFFDLPFNPAVINQVEDRLHRKGQKNTVNVIRLIAEKTVEDKVLQILKEKSELATKVVDGQISSNVGVSNKELLKAIGAFVGD